ncbi:2Fe-2S iron-sulfur cluster-binding protein [Litorivivens sp.]|uniref:2Fe-2S iron-sulfur cluster-binding protein n=1 Tax=Litorivivens sp. TaxID=2020868 RepID=UPI003561DC29
MAPEPFTIQLSDGRALPGRADHTLLRQLQDAGCSVPVACSNGNCGRCFATLLSGVTHPPSDRNKVPLCTHFADADITLQLPQRAHWRCYSCELIAAQGSEAVVRLPAGRLDVSGAQWLLVSGGRAYSAQLIANDKRLLTLQASLPICTENRVMVRLLNVDSQPGGRYQLRNEAQVVLCNLTASVAREIQISLIQCGLIITR